MIILLKPKMLSPGCVILRHLRYGLSAIRQSMHMRLMQIILLTRLWYIDFESTSGLRHTAARRHASNAQPGERKTWQRPPNHHALPSATYNTSKLLPGFFKCVSRVLVSHFPLHSRSHSYRRADVAVLAPLLLAKAAVAARRGRLLQLPPELHPQLHRLVVHGHRRWGQLHLYTAQSTAVRRAVAYHAAGGHCAKGNKSGLPLQLLPHGCSARVGALAPRLSQLAHAPVTVGVAFVNK